LSKESRQGHPIYKSQPVRRY